MSGGPSPVTEWRPCVTTARSAKRERAGAPGRPAWARTAHRVSAWPSPRRGVSVLRPAGHRSPHGHVGLALSSKRGVGTLRVSLNSCFVTTHK